ncbi:PH domain-containing protein [Bdellovibrio sp. 22V]|uniref:PH domain-containing protein n=1 Tax=Bdellovibrio sp. 22V TaxID=3044166 RepID=UPI002542FA51|nr:PH domain-containing protein [Bdellovibrio sp. 22V]WII72350.1 PH domain-containing protein [Bdellovibrio sp. 22V]
MAFKLRENEEVKMSASFHWSDYLVAGFWAAICTPGFLMTVIEKSERAPSPMLFALIAYSPIIYKFIKNKSRKYLITNQRLYIETGILTKTATDVPLNKINDIAFSQNFIERLFDVGSLNILTGNDKGNAIRGIVNPEIFRECLSKHCNHKAS